MLARHLLSSRERGDVGLFKSPEEKAAAQARRAQEKSAAQAQRDQEKFARSPVGQATAAHERGDVLFQTVVPVDESGALILSKIEAIGWHLEHVGCTFVVSNASGTTGDGVVGVHVGGELTGVYLFRRS
jgi:hypothetical protein